MKKLFHLFYFAMCLSPYAFPQEYGWKDISNRIPDFPFDTVINEYNDTLISQFTDLYFINDNEGWVTAWHPYDSDSAGILHTMDGGNTWEVQIVGRACKVIWMLDSQTGYAGSQAGGIIYKTTDGGNHWNYHGSTGSTIRDISFAPGSDSGYVCSDMNSSFHKITDDKVTAIYTGLPGFWSGVSHTTNNLWFCQSGSIYKWANENLISIFCNNHGYFQSLYFHDAQHGWAGDQDFIQGYYEKDDIFVVIEITGYVMISGLHALDKDNLWACLFEGQILYTSKNAYDFGYENGHGWTNVEWESQIHPWPGTHWDEIFFSSLTNGYVVGNYNRIMKYTEVSSIRNKDQAVEFELFPNPVEDIIQVQCSDLKSEIGEVDIFSIDGEMILKKVLSKGDENVEINLSQLRSGIYLFKITIDNRRSTKKIIKELRCSNNFLYCRSKFD